MLERILSEKSCFSTEGDEERFTDTRCVERKLNINYEFACRESDLHGFGVSHAFIVLSYASEETVSEYEPKFVSKCNLIFGRESCNFENMDERI